MLIGDKLRTKRKSRGLTQEQATNLYNDYTSGRKISKATLQRWENDILSPTVNDIETLMKVYKCTMPRLLDIKIDTRLRFRLEYSRLTEDEKKIHNNLLFEFSSDYDAVVHANGVYCCLSTTSRRKVIKVLLDEYDYCKLHKTLKRGLPLSRGYVQKAYDKLLKYAKY